MTPLAEFTEGSLMTLDEEPILLNAGWSEPAVGSDVTRIGSLVTVSMQVKNVAEAAYANGTTYAAKEVVTEAGALYESIAGGNVGHKPSSDAGAHWKLLTAAATTVLTLPVQYRPLVATVTEDGKFSVATTGVVTFTGSMEAAAGSYIPFQLSYRAAVQTP
jgi:hypothetical protein